MLITERIYVLEDVDVQAFLGVNNSNLMLLRTLFPKLRLVAHHNVLKIMGDSRETDRFLEVLEPMVAYCREYNLLPEDVILRIAQGAKLPADDVPKHLILHGTGGKSIIARGDNQQKLVEAFEANDLVFAIGPAGTGKTFVAISLAVRALKSKQVRRIILSRPAVEAGEKLGFLPGEMKDKLDPYLQPLYDALEEMIPAVKLKEYIENNIIQIAPLAYMRGRTLNDAVVILDEAQNTTELQMKMFLTRLGANAKMIVTGDITQTDLPRGVHSGLRQALNILQGTRGIGYIAFQRADIVRHPLVQRVVDAYDRYDAERKKEAEAAAVVAQTI
ncbi:PhoH family protein [Porphyromonas gingivalis]|uniref:PhoH-like protein n=3 Tax=Porphyromonas gingivalis TaxID=837 RepID=Q7MVR9_PORGI|nr:PhoH family protein [Porphyromonas gingivalis]AAQ66101.1 PhoH family protein [Porphyromonas gingivalis W83]AKV64206.1 phosphate starvation-inducible protein PhoH, predicted ATPase [Porphyromonas gingivalis]ALA93517.1 phosphate starvation-inducible protein PhoH, predicted ATPase [Porphyromonas gingivalis AJW4]ALO29679.1 phosphate starvation-inducible protein PhoH, predicted ATPase [Porphyromonas gingivalis A7A1-28]ATR89890.1 PhoH family protein [Porphyromonas gingivalis]